jgi:hypothetical protein
MIYVQIENTGDVSRKKKTIKINRKKKDGHVSFEKYNILRTASFI